MLFRSQELHRIGQQYFTERQGQNQPILTGPPYVHVWAALILFLVKVEALADKAPLLRQHAADITSPSELVPMIRICRIAKAFEPGMHRLTLAVSEELRPVLRAVLVCLEQLGGDIKYGPPPKSPLERTVQKLLANSTG